jgi:hypothetical protein
MDEVEANTPAGFHNLMRASGTPSPGPTPRRIVSVPRQCPWPAALDVVISPNPALYAVGLAGLSSSEHAVPWRQALPGRFYTAACGRYVRVTVVTGAKVRWRLESVLTCHRCAVATGRP